MPTDFLSVLRALQERGVRYVLVGGLAVLLHGIDRLTADIDLVVDLAPEQASKAVDTLLELGFKTHAPVDARQFADAAVRKSWQRDSGMLVLSFWDPQHRHPTVDLFADYPMEFEALYAQALLLSLVGTTVRVASVEHLIRIKRAAGRPQDLVDANRLAELSGKPRIV
jgi:predicted nucleotidyltransferase